MEIELKELDEGKWEVTKWGDFIICFCSHCGKQIRRAKGRFKENPFVSPPLCHGCINKKASQEKHGDFIRLDDLDKPINVSFYTQEKYEDFFKRVYITQRYKYTCRSCHKEVLTRKNMYHDRSKAPLRLCPSCKRKETAIEQYGEYAPSKIGKEKRIQNGWKPKYSTPIDINNFNEHSFFNIPSTQVLKCKCTLCDEEFLKEKRFFGDSNPFKIPELLCPKCIKKRSAVDSYYQLKSREQSENFILLNSLKEFINLGAHAYVDVQCTKCSNKFKFHYYCGYRPNCNVCNPPNRSLGETEVYNFIIENYNGLVLRNDRELLQGKEIDILIPELKIAIEYDGLYWHTEEKGKTEKYHRTKQREVEALGYRMIFIREDEWYEKKEICKNILSSLILDITKRKRIFARKCQVKEINNEEASLFLNENHIQGSGSIGRIKIGLFYNDLLISIVTFGKPRFNKNYEYEIIRYAVLGDLIIIGGFAKMLNYFKRKYDPLSIITYADNRYFSGTVYNRNGFVFLGETEPNYKYLKNHKLFNRMIFQKHKLKDILEQFDSDKTEKENMKDNNYNIIYDCGNKIFVWNKF